ncbi:hypothetical protein ABD68_12430 [Bacillus endophyticus]|uniref:hypothetical protein n=1 Tax=Priestia endophytica TaxID=135735 RepID=UPI0018CC95E6|nr:hypothetical protein [Priestia endophytica]MBG9812372.1 hypothetical protein [Priestia endophytica]
MNIEKRIKRIRWKGKGIAAIILIVVVLWYFFPLFSITNVAEKVIKKLHINFSNPVVSGLTGALIGGILPIVGGIYTQARQFKIKGIVLRKNVIYSPLFDELVKMKKNIPQDGEYPEAIVFGKKDNGYYYRNTLIFDAWERIKSDVRFIEVPTYLAKELDDFQQSGKTYMELREKASEALYQEIQPIVEGPNGLSEISINMGKGNSNLLNALLMGKSITAENVKNAFHIGETDEIVSAITERLNACRDLPSIQKVRTQYADFQERLDQLIQGTQSMIDFIQRKYEHKSRSI